ncbi:MAG: family 10 glycosylhydrolase, partial [Symploca sp. SIO2G7]|nr:family 10 glycosylhydrolase [Symploca sp. SIO2G7]
MGLGILMGKLLNLVVYRRNFPRWDTTRRHGDAETRRLLTRQNLLGKLLVQHGRNSLPVNQKRTIKESAVSFLKTFCLLALSVMLLEARAQAESIVVPTQESTPQKVNLTAVEVTAMIQELEGLIGRFESALLAAEAANGDLDFSLSTTIEKLLAEQATEATKGMSSSDSGGPYSTNPILVQANRGLQNFRDAIAKKDFPKARQEWSQTRRLLWENYPLDRKLAQPEIRAVWLDRGTIVKAKSEKDLAKLFDQLAAAGFNTVFFETVNASYPIYPSSVAPEQNPLVQGWDPLAAAVKLAHKREMELHAWVWIFAAANQRHNILLNQPVDYLGPVLETNPDWANLDHEGRTFHPDTKKAFLDPANPEVQRYLISLLEEIASKYEVDGIQFDYIRYPFQDPNANQTYGYSMIARQRFHQQTGVDPAKVKPSDRNLWREWTDFRTQQIDRFVTSASRKLRQQNPDLILSAAVFPLPRPERIQKLQQHWEAWAEKGEFDLIVPMTYALDTDSLRQLTQPVVSFSNRNQSLIVPGIRLLQLPDIVAFDQIQLLRDLPVGGYALFAAENLNDNLHDIFRRTQGPEKDATPEPVPYRQPLKTAADRYQTLLREWCFLLENNQLKMQEPALSEWSRRAETLSILFELIAEKPSTSNVSKAQSALSSFRPRFQKWMQDYATEKPYQVQVWDNRLQTIERLLEI